MLFNCDLKKKKKKEKEEKKRNKTQPHTMI